MKRFSLVAIYITLVICLGFTIQNRWKGDHGDAWKSTISSDGYGYYAYLPCIFIYHHLDYNKAWDEERKVLPGAIGFAPRLANNIYIDKWFPGVAILLIPFFLAAYLLSYILGYSTGGYEFPFQAAVSIGALFYLAVGLIFLRKLLKLYSISEFITCITLILVVFGTNLFYYSTIEASMSHVYSFGLTSFFLFYTKKSMDEFRLKNLLPMVVSISILILIRPVNILTITFIPFLAGGLKETFSYIKKFFKAKETFLLLFIAASILFIQLFLWYLQTGHFFVWSYQSEGFDFKHPHFADILFSYRNGWFIYSPLMFIAILGGLITFYRQKIFYFLNALLFFLLVTYILSSWWAWWYGGAYGLRAFIDFYPVFGLFLALFLNSLTAQWLKNSIILLGFLCIGLNLFQINQYLNAILPCDGMTKEKYWKIFFKNSPSYKNLFDHPDTTGFNFLKTYTYKNDFEQNTWGNDQDITTTYAHSGTHSAFVNVQNQFSPVFSLEASMLPQVKSLFIYVRLWVLMPNFNNNAAILVTASPEKGGEAYFWTPSSLQGFVFKPNTWSQAYALVALPTFKNPSDKLSVYVLSTKGEVYIDDMEVAFETPQ